MPIQLNKILTDIAEEKALHPNNHSVSAEEVEEAWCRVSKNNKLSVHETRSIFKVLQKKYEQEKQKNISSWKLFEVMNNMHRNEDNEQMIDEDEEFEMLEVQEDDENNFNQAGSDGDSSSKSSISAATTPEKVEKPEKMIIPEKCKRLVTPKLTPKATAAAAAGASAAATTAAAEDKKLLNLLVQPAKRNTQINAAIQLQQQKPQQQQQQQQQQQRQRTNIKTTLMQHKGITLKRTQVGSKGNHPTYGGLEKKNETTTLQLPEAIKRKLNEDLSITTTSSCTHPPKKIIKINNSNNSNRNNYNSNIISATTITTITPQEPVAAAVVIKEEPEDKEEPEVKFEPGTVITMPANGLVPIKSEETVAIATPLSTPSTSVVPSNGFSPRIEEIDFSKDIIFDSGTSAVSGSNNNNDKTKIEGGGIINMGNFDNALPPTFFKNLCNSSRHEAFGLYVANAMNRMSKSAAAKLEVNVLRAVADVMSEEQKP